MTDTGISSNARTSILTLVRSSSECIQNARSQFEKERKFQISWVMLDMLLALGYSNFLTVVIDEDISK